MSPAKEPGSILDLIQQLLVSDPAELVPDPSSPCISILRLMFGSVEMEEDEWEPIPAGYDRKSFETLRWRYHGSPKNKKMHGHPKVLVDVSKIPEQFLAKRIVYRYVREFDLVWGYEALAIIRLYSNLFVSLMFPPKHPPTICEVLSGTGGIGLFGLQQVPHHS